MTSATDKKERLKARKALVEAATARRPKRMQPHPTPDAIVLAYTRELRAISKAMDAEIWDALRELDVRADAADGFAPKSTTDAIIKRLTRALGKIAGRQNLVGMIDKLANRTGEFSRAQWRKQLQQSMGISLGGDLKLDLFVAAWRKENTELIKSLATDKVDRVRTVLADAGPGTRVEQIAKRIQEETETTASRAELIARDQVLKLNADVTEAQHAAAGITEYVWSTSSDERVRKSHKDLDGQKFEYSKPPIVDPKTGRRANPGQDYQCRCVAIPVLPTE
jgi:SPP1 gp7 family putative phage head morphogenesis protein